MTISSELCLGVIPARMQSVRLPGKPLLDLGGISVIERVWRQARQAKNLSYLVVATDSEEIADAALGFGAEVVMTSPHCANGTERVAEALDIIEANGKVFSMAANIQGDMPFINPNVIDKVIENLQKSEQKFGMATVAIPIQSLEEFQSLSSVKVVLGIENQALYFSRAPIPCVRDSQKLILNEDNPYGYKHIGLYVYRKEVLKALPDFKSPISETREQLEQLRALANGIYIKVTLTSRESVAPAIEIDTPQDIDAAREYLARR